MPLLCPTKEMVGQTRVRAQWARVEVPVDLREVLVPALGSLPTPCPSPGPFAVISVMIGSLTESLMPSENFMETINGTNMTVNEAERDAARVELVATITVLTGIFQVRAPSLAWQGARSRGAPGPQAVGHFCHLSFQVALGLLQFGFVVTYLSDPLVRGYTTAASVHVLISQLKNVFGVSVGEHSGPISLFKVSGDSLLPRTPLALTCGPQRAPQSPAREASAFLSLFPLPVSSRPSLRSARSCQRPTWAPW